jgi:hypothetical protein
MVVTTVVVMAGEGTLDSGSIRIRVYGFVKCVDECGVTV